LTQLARGGRRPQVIAVAATLALALVLVTVYVATLSPSHSAATGPGRSAATGPGRSAATEPGQVQVGVKAGDSIAAYVAAARQRLEALQPGSGQSVVALVTLSDYASAQQLTAIVAGVPVLAVFTHVYVNGARTDVLKFNDYSHLVDDMRQVSQDSAMKAQDYALMFSAEQGADDESKTLRQTYAQDEAAQRAQSQAYGSTCVCVFAVVVSAPAPELANLAARDHVRAVDPAVDAGPVGGIVFAAPRPEETGRADGQNAEMSQ
jgi:hypothetical protein